MIININKRLYVTLLFILYDNARTCVLSHYLLVFITLYLHITIYALGRFLRTIVLTGTNNLVSPYKQFCSTDHSCTFSYTNRIVRTNKQIGMYEQYCLLGMTIAENRKSLARFIPKITLDKSSGMCYTLDVRWTRNLLHEWGTP